MPLPINGFDRAFIPYQDDLRTDETNDGIFTAVIGSPPNRQFVIEWRTTYFERSGNANFEAIFSEDSGILSVIYGATADNGAQETSGIQAEDIGIFFTQFSCGDSTLVSGLRVNYVPGVARPTAAAATTPPPPPPPSASAATTTSAPPPPPPPPPPPHLHLPAADHPASAATTTSAATTSATAAASTTTSASAPPWCTAWCRG